MQLQLVAELTRALGWIWRQRPQIVIAVLARLFITAGVVVIADARHVSWQITRFINDPQFAVLLANLRLPCPKLGDRFSTIGAAWYRRGFILGVALQLSA